VRKLKEVIVMDKNKRVENVVNKGVKKGKVIGKVDVSKARVLDADNLIEGLDPSRSLKMVHMFTAVDGSTHIEELLLPIAHHPSGMVHTLFDGATARARMIAYQGGLNTPWHYARNEELNLEEIAGSVVFLIHGDLLITLDDNPLRHVLVKQGTLMFNEDFAGKGHITTAVSESGTMVMMQLDLKDPWRFFKAAYPVPKR
jgi:hypothetical protein